MLWPIELRRHQASVEGSVTEESDLHCSDERPFYRRAAGPPAGHRSLKRVPTERLELPRTQALDLLRLPLSPRRHSGPAYAGPTHYSRKYSLRGAPSKPTTAQAALLESGVPTRTGTDRCDPAFRSTPCRRARRAARASRATQTGSHFAACWSAQKDQSGICGLRMAGVLRVMNVRPGSTSRERPAEPEG